MIIKIWYPFFLIKLFISTNILQQFKKFSKTKSTKKIKNKEKEDLSDATSELYDKQIEKYYGIYEKFSDAKKSKLEHKYKPINLRIEEYDYKGWVREEESDDTTLEDDEKEESADLHPFHH